MEDYRVLNLGWQPLCLGSSSAHGHCTTETLGFQHLDLEVTVPRVVIFRDAIIDLFQMEMGARFTTKAQIGFLALLNYVGGAYIYIRREYAVRIKIIGSSWRTANSLGNKN